jgi:hypothetical protein
MNRGAGHIRQTIATLIAEHPHGAWTTSDLSRFVYVGEVTKARRVAVARALRRMKLPGTWRTERCWDGWRSSSENYLCDPCDLLSMRFKVDRLGYHPDHLKPGGCIFQEVERAKRWRDASAIQLNVQQIGWERPATTAGYGKFQNGAR